MNDSTRSLRQRLHVLDGLLMAIERRHELVDILSGCESTDLALQEIITRLGVTEPAARVLLDMQFRRLLPQEVDKLQQEAAQLRATLDP
ncbi:DNA gyrase subunit A [Streptomyces sp. NPDC017991]|uniref:DNA gyrase subunit A n=1 Tax=Streptomyces sp. NPDC017991 TaxID=3365026 RepID=UPI0037AAD6E4